MNISSVKFKLIKYSKKYKLQSFYKENIFYVKGWSYKMIGNYLRYSKDYNYDS